MEEGKTERRLKADRRSAARPAEVGKKDRRLGSDRRRDLRLAEENEISIDIIPDREASVKEIISYNTSGDISVSGAKIQGNILLPVDTVLKIDITLKNLRQNITSVGKVKWNKVILEDTYYEAGIEFVDNPDEAIQRLYERERILKEEWTKLLEINDYEIPPGEEDFIPVEEWSKTHETGKKKKVASAAASKPVNKIIEPVEKNMKTCRYCARELRSDAGICEHCGKPVPEETVRKVFL